MRAFFKDKIGEKAWFSNFEVFKTSPLKMCSDLGKKPNVQLGDVQTFVVMLTENIDWLQMQVEQKQFGLKSVDIEVKEQAYKQISSILKFHKEHLVTCWGGSVIPYIDKIEKLSKVQMQLYDQLLKGAAA